MRILAVITGMKSGGAERVMATLCNEFTCNNEVILAILKSRESDYYLNDKVKVVSGNIKHKNMFSSVRFVKTIIEKQKPDIILSFMTKSNIISLLARKKSKHKCPIVITERANPYYSKKIYVYAKKHLYPLADGFVFQTNQSRDYYKKNMNCEGIVIRNPLARDFNIKPYIGERTKRIVCTARLSPEKNQQFLIKTFNMIKDKYKDYNLEIYGEGPDKERLQQLIDSLNATDRVKLMGRRRDIIEAIKDAELFVLPSNSEGMPNSLLEALALGIPSIATDAPIGGSALIIKNNINGILIPMEDSIALINAIERIITDKEFAKKISKEGPKVIKEFDTDIVCKEWEKYLLHILGGK